MVRGELVEGIRNAVERGSNLEQVKQSFITAGYNPKEVNEAAQFFSGNFASHPMILYKGKNSSSIPETTGVKPGNLSFFKKNFKVILLGGILFILIIALLIVLFFKDKIIGLFS